MKKIILLSLILILFACGKYTTPNKVNRKLDNGTWNIQEFIDNDKSLMKKYAGVTISFGENGTVATTSENAASGTWSSGTDKNPALIYLNFPTELDSMHVFSDDWIVYKLTSKECVLKRKKDETFDYDASLDRISLLKKQD
ncbi:MAG: hypothetical protein ACK5B9_07820 [Flavobacteriia bacterium]|jgi:hypothetical protein